jgi:hypothetical protein
MPCRRAIYKGMPISLNPKTHERNAKKMADNMHPIEPYNPVQKPNYKPINNQIAIGYNVTLSFN